MKNLIASISLPENLLKEAEKAAKETGQTKSEFFRNALRTLLEDLAWKKAQKKLSLAAGRAGILTEEDVQKAVEDVRYA
jgi:metal-responsive CopG/Arc/MetJ family transcriptional regulator